MPAKHKIGHGQKETGYWRSGENKKRLNRHFCKPLASVRLGIHRKTHIFMENEITSSTLVCATHFAEIVQRLVQSSHTRGMVVRFYLSVHICSIGVVGGARCLAKAEACTDSISVCCSF